jgi:predicted ArsR family transcriptional regulator
VKNTQQLPVGVPGDLTPSAHPGASTHAETSHADPDVDATTRQRVARSILEHGPSTATELAERLGLTAAAVRRHLDVLLERGLLAGRERRTYGARGRGRPAKAFALTDAGRADFYSAYDQLAIDALDALIQAAGPDAVSALARRRLASVEQRFQQLNAGIVDGGPVLTSTEALAQALTADGYVASIRPAGAGEQLCQHHCPVAHVAEQFPQICEAETELFSRLLGVHVQRLATIAHGDGVCTTHVPVPRAQPDQQRQLQTANGRP